MEEVKIFKNNGNSIQGIATPGKGAEEMEVWKSSVAQGKSSSLHCHDSEGIFVISKGEGEFDAKFEERVKKVDGIVDAELDKHFYPETGFKVGPSEIHYEAPEYEELFSGSIWKQADQRLGIQYTAKQKPVNDRLKPNEIACRPHLVEAFNSAAGLFGGSAAGSVLNYAEAQTEWIIANLDKSELEITTDDEIMKVLPQDGMPGAIRAEELKALFSSLGKAEEHLTKSQVNVLRREFITFFK